MKLFKYTVYALIILSVFSSCKNSKDQSTDIDPDSRSKIISSETIIEQLEKGENIILNNAAITGDINFNDLKDKDLMTPLLVKTHVQASILFYNCTFKGKVSAFKKSPDKVDICEFDRAVCFMNCTFQDSVNFNSSEFNDLVNFSNTEFHSDAKFIGTSYNYKKVYFDKAVFFEKTMFNLSEFQGSASFFEAKFNKSVNFQLSDFKGSAFFNSAVFDDKSVFSTVRFEHDAFFNYAEFYKAALFNNTAFWGRSEFIKAKFLESADFKDCNYYGKVTYNNCEINRVLNFTGSFFLRENLLKEDVILKTDSSELIFK